MKKLIFIIGMLISGAAFSVANEVSVDQLEDGVNGEVSRWSVGAASTLVQTPGKAREGQRVFGFSLEAQRRIALNKTISTNTIINWGTFFKDEKAFQQRREVAVNSYKGASNYQQLTIAQSLTKSVQTRYGVFFWGGDLGLTELTSKTTEKDFYVLKSDSAEYYPRTIKSQFKLYGPTVGISVRFEFSSGVTPFVSYRVTSFNSGKEYYVSKTTGGVGGENLRSGSNKIKDYDVQAISTGLAYKF